MLKLVSSIPDVPTEQIANHITDYAPALAISMLGTINGDTSYDSLKKPALSICMTGGCCRSPAVRLTMPMSPCTGICCI
ncbi:hypothetical protein [Photobacterium sp. Hal280]|uniref:hypothetical protein n=1 Tax=Photobacterium sp. Hal280 TaxID=3035163 RepID=UPI00301D9B5F